MGIECILLNVADISKVTKTAGKKMINVMLVAFRQTEWLGGAKNSVGSGGKVMLV